MMGGYLQVASDEPDLVSAADHARVLVHRHHVGVAAELTGHAHNLPQQVDLVADRLLRGRPEEGSDNQSESSMSQTRPEGQQRPSPPLTASRPAANQRSCHVTQDAARP